MDILSGRSFVMLHYRNNHPQVNVIVFYILHHPHHHHQQFSALTKSDQDPWGEIDWQDWLAEGTKRYIFNASNFVTL